MAAKGMKGLAKDTAIYGMSSILGRSLNWCLNPFYMYVFADPSEVGKMSTIYAYVALFLVLLTYGMEIGFFRFMNNGTDNPKRVYSTTLISLASTSALFIGLCFLCITPISSWIGFPDNKDYILMMAITVAIDAFMTIPYAYLRYKKLAKRFMSIRMLFILLNIFLNIFFLYLCPIIYKAAPQLIDWFYNPTYGIGYIFLANLLATGITLLLMLPDTTKGLQLSFDKDILKRMLHYSFPLLILGVSGVISQVVAQLTYKYIFDDPTEAFRQLGIYSSNLKIAGIITMFIQAFRYAYEPFFFGAGKDKDNRQSYADAMKYFILFSLLIYLGIIFYIDVITYILSLIGKNYVVGLNILPTAMMGEILFGIYFNLSVWYKITDNTKYGAYFSITGCILQIALNLILVPIYGYIASAWATLISNFVILAISYFIGQKYYPIKYDLRTIFIYFAVAAIFFAAAMYIPIENEVLRTIYRTVLLLAFTFFIIKKENIQVDKIPFIGKKFSKK